jgi:monoamine oxidase
MASALPSDIDVAIVGAGAAGVAAARRLANHGASVLLVEALDRIGGRSWTRMVDGLPLDLGCGWLHSGERNPWVGRAEALGRRVWRGPSAWGAQYRNLGFSAADQEAAWSAFEAFSRRIREQHWPSDCAADAIPRDDPWRNYVDTLSSYMNGAQLCELSIADFLAYEDTATEENWRLPEGYGALIAADAWGLPLVLATPVHAIAHTPGGVALSTPQGTISAKAAIVTLSTNALAGDSLTLPAAFDGARHAAHRIPLGLADKLFLRLPDPESMPPEQHLIGDPHANATGSYYLRPMGMPVIECFFGGAAARRLEAEGEAGMLAFARAELGALLGRDFAARLEPLACSAWAKVPGIGGSYSHALPGHADARRTLAEPVDERILLAGEACSPTDFSTAHGAYQTGVAAAERLIATIFI